MNATPAQRAEFLARAEAIAYHLWPNSTASRPALRVRNVRAGHAYYDAHAITLPAWLFLAPETARNPLATKENGAQYLVYYIAHELCHFLCGRGIHHGPAFQAKLRAMVPNFYFFERGYKPRAYAAEMARAARFDQTEAA